MESSYVTPQRTGTLKARKLALVWKQYDNVPGHDKTYYAHPGAVVNWQGGTNAGYEYAYGGDLVYWCSVWSEDLYAWADIGLTEDEVEWND